MKITDVKNDNARRYAKLIDKNKDGELSSAELDTFEHFAGKIGTYLDQHKIPKEKLTYLGTTQEIEMTQADGAMAILKQAFIGALSMQNLPTMLRSADDAYSPIMASYDPAVYQRNREAMVMDSEVAATPVLKRWLGGQVV